MDGFWGTIRFITMGLPALVIAMLPWLLIGVPFSLMLEQFEDAEGGNDIAMILSFGVAGVCYLAIPLYASFTKLCLASASWLAIGDWDYTPSSTQKDLPIKKIIGCLLLTVTWAALILLGYWLESLDWPELILGLIIVPFVLFGWIATLKVIELFFND